MDLPDEDVIRDETKALTRDFVAEVSHDPAVAVVPGVAEVPVALRVTVGLAAQG